MSTFDVIVVGGGPAGSAAAWSAATRGARVLILDKARFPRDKTCGDGLTPAAVRMLERMGLGETLKRFYMADRVRFRARDMVYETAIPRRRHHPGVCYVAPRLILDDLLLRHAAAAGAEVRDGVEVEDVVLDGGRITGVIAGEGGRSSAVHAPVVIAADGARSGLSRRAGLSPRVGGPLGTAVRVQTEADRPDVPVLEVHCDLRWKGHAVPGYGWIFPMGGGRVNVGVGLASTVETAKSPGVGPLAKQFIDSLPGQWKIPPVDQLRASGQLRGAKLPMGFSLWPPWRPGILFAGDAAGVANPLSGAGISKALQSGALAGKCAVEALGGDGPGDLRAYESALRGLWGSRYARGRWILRALSRPGVMNLATALGIRMPMKSAALKIVLYGPQRFARDEVY
ncbi:MAG: NAD(P)/FAD-dependent oxidoreductase [Actinomycetota bacterium]|nr:NAD(P)/FAD-dependent oxidoreductase [Actinomycetota bacterium]